MVKPKDPYKITLLDLNGFWTYENREVLVANDNDSNSALDLDDP